MKKFRLNGRHFFITYAGNPKLTKAQILDFFQNQQMGTSKPDCCIVSEENSPQDPEKGTHFHAYLRYPKQKNLYNPRVFDIDGFHPNIQTVKNILDCIKYVKKDENWIIFGDLNKPPTPYEIMNNFETFNRYFQSKMEENPFTFNVQKYIVKNKWNLEQKSGISSWISDFNKVQEVYASSLLQAKRATPKRFDKRKFQKLFKTWSGYEAIVDYVNEIMKYPNYDESQMWPKKQPHLYLVGPPNTGKTTFVDMLREYYSVYPFGAADRWWPRYSIFTYSIIEWGEFSLSSKAMPFGELLKLLGGEQMNLPVKGSSVFKMDRQAFILSSNKTLEQHLDSRFPGEYGKAEIKVLEPALRARINELIIPDGITLFPLIELISKHFKKG